MKNNPNPIFQSIEYGDIPDLDAGRIPYPKSKSGKYAVGERKSIVVFIIDSFSTRDLATSFQSLYSVLTHPSNRLYIDFLLVDWEGSGRSNLENSLPSVPDCSLYTLYEKRSKGSSHFSLIEATARFLTEHQYEQFLLVNVPSTKKHNF